MKILRKSSDGRIALIDEVRGFSILCMVVYHLFYDLVYIFSVPIPIFTSPLINGLQEIFAGLFILISGASCAFSRNNLKRGIFCFSFGMILTAATFFFMPDELIVFGILHLLGMSMILYAISRKLLAKIPAAAAIPLFVFLFAVSYDVSYGFLGIYKVFTISLPSALYRTNYLAPLGFINAAFFSSDYFPLLPWLFLFIAGSYIGKLFKKMPPDSFAARSHVPLLSFVGRNTFIIYLVHQPIILGILYIIFRFI